MTSQTDHNTDKSAAGEATGANSGGADEMAVAVGPFEVVEFLGRGGMGEVWRGVHRRHEVEVAVKLVTHHRAEDPDYLRRFANEAASVAALNHPSIVTVLDYGEVDASSTFFTPRTPYLAMELADAGSLGDLSGRLDWPQLRRLLLALLDGLAHAHARGVVHRDLKPSNILLVRDAEERLQPKISDFGLAYLAERALQGAERRGRSAEGQPAEDPEDEVAGQSVGGTPRYMAPEQFQGRWREYGPWTDLYALGCLTWQLCCGRPPFRGSRMVELARLHLEEPLPAFQPSASLNVPDGLGGWLARLLQKAPEGRFRRAADAAARLRALPVTANRARDTQTDDGSSEALRDFGAPASTRQTAPPTLLSPTSITPASAPADASHTATAQSDASPTPVQTGAPPLPADWSGRLQTRFPTHLMDTGLQLFGLRELPVVGRREERDHLWEALRQVHDGDGARMVLLRGAAGTGKTRLARWLRESAHQVGAAGQMLATHSPGGGPADGLAAMLRRHLACAGLDASQTRERLRRWHTARGHDEPFAWRALGQILNSPDPEDPAAVAFSEESEKLAVLRRFLERAAADRPLVVHLDDLQWGWETLRFVDYLLEHPRRRQTNLLVVATVRREALAERPFEADRLEELLERPPACDRRLGPLPDEQHRRLIEECLRLEPALAHRLAARSGNNPLFVVQLVADWVDRGLLEPGERGFELAERTDDLLPDGLYEVWSGRLDRLLAGRSPEETIALELGAALGLEVDTEEWRWICKARQIALPTDLLRTMIRQHLVEQTDRGWAFVHSMLRETLERRAREAGRWQDHCRVSARMLREAAGTTSRDFQPHRLARYHLAAGDEAKAVEPLLEAVQNRIDMADNDAAAYLLRQLASTLESLGIDAEKKEFGWFLVRKAALLVRRSEFAEAREILESVLDKARTKHWRDIAIEARITMSHCSYYLGDPDRSLRSSNKLIELLDREEEPVDYARALRVKAEVYLSTGKYSDARPLLAEAFALTEQPAPTESGKITYQTGVAALFSNDYQEARRWFERGVRLFEEQGNQFGIARCLNGLGEVERREGNFNTASKHYRRASRNASLVESPELADIEGSHAQLEIERSNFGKAKSILEKLQASYGRAGTTYTQTIVASLLVCCDAALADWRDFESDMDSLTTRLDKTSVATPDIPEALALGARKAQEHGRSGVAGKLAELAARQYDALDDADKAAALRKEFSRATTTPSPDETDSSDQAD